MTTHDDRELSRLSRRMSKALRHAPHEFGLVLDAGGWTDVDDLVRAMARLGGHVTRALVEHVVTTSDKQRYTFDESGQRIRANQGHSIPVDLGLEPLTPPNVLFHGTIERFLPAIRRHGLLAMRRHHVHLSSDEETARHVGARRGDPVVLRVDAAAMVADGHAWYRSVNGVWLTDEVPARYLGFPDKPAADL